MDPKRRALLTAGAAVAATAAMPRVLAQQPGSRERASSSKRGPFASTTRRQGRASRSC